MKLRLPSLSRFSLRTLFVLVTVLAVGLGYVGHEWRIVKERREFWPLFNDPAFSVRVLGVYPNQQSSVPWLRLMMGDSAASNLIYNPRQDAAGQQLKQVRELFPEAKIWGWPGDKSLPDGISPLDQNFKI